MFYCRNYGFLGKYIYSSYVNDGVCDCCDGSDEYNNPNIKCENNCEKLFSEYLSKKYSEIEFLKQSRDVIREYYDKGKKIYDDAFKEYEKENKDLENKQIELDNALIEKNNEEKKEAEV